MGSFSDYLENAFMDHIFNSAWSQPSAVYLCLCTAGPSDIATGASMNETADDDGYTRIAITFGAAASRRVTQNANVTFPTATGDYAEDITHWAIADRPTYGEGNVLAHGAFDAAKTVYSGNVPRVLSGEVYIEFTAGFASDYLAEAFLDKAFRNQAFGKPDTYVALLGATASDDDTGSTITEASWSAYARVQVNESGGSSPAWDLATGTSPTTVDNTHQIDFANADGDDTVVGMAIVDASTNGNLLIYDNSMGDQAIGNGDPVNFPAGALDITCT